MLKEAQVEQFWRDGVLVADSAVSDSQLSALRAHMFEWVEQSRERTAGWGDTLDGRPRFDVEPERIGQPSLRRVNAPSEISHAYLDVVRESAIVEMVGDLIGPNVKHHHNKINTKLPGAGTKVDWHQDFAFTPHSNDDLVTALLMVDEVTPTNGPLEVVLGSHRGPLHSLWHGEVFTGAAAPELASEFRRQSVQCTGAAGSVCLMHTRLVHGSAPNVSDASRTLFIIVYSAADAVPCSPNPVPNQHEGLMVKGEDPRTIRTTPYKVRAPEFPKNASFFSQQSNSERHPDSDLAQK